MEIFLKRINFNKMDIKVNGLNDEKKLFPSIFRKKHNYISSGKFDKCFKEIMFSPNVTNVNFDGATLKFDYIIFKGLDYEIKNIVFNLDDSLKNDKNFINFIYNCLEIHEDYDFTWGNSSKLKENVTAVDNFNKFLNNDKKTIFFTLEELTKLKNYIEYLWSKSINDSRIVNREKRNIRFLNMDYILYLFKGFTMGYSVIEIVNFFISGFSLMPMVFALGFAGSALGINKIIKYRENKENNNIYRKYINILEKEIQNRKNNKIDNTKDLEFEGHDKNNNTGLNYVNKPDTFMKMLNNLKQYTAKNPSIVQYKNEVKALEFIYKTYLLELESIGSSIEFPSIDTNMALCSLMDRYLNLAIVLSSKTNKNSNLYNEMILPTMEEVLKFLNIDDILIENDKYLKSLVMEYNKDYSNMKIDVTIKRLAIIKKINNHISKILRNDLLEYMAIRDLKFKSIN